MTIDIKSKCEEFSEKDGNKVFVKLVLREDEFENLLQTLLELVPTHYVAPESVARVLERLGKPAAAEKLRSKLPTVLKTRSGDIGEIIATEFIEEELGYSVPIRKLRWRDHNEMPMRGDDVIGVHVDATQNTIGFLKVEAKGNRVLSRSVLSTARDQLDDQDGLPTSSALTFVAERLHEIGNHELADQIEEAHLLHGIQGHQVTHFIFTHTSSDPDRLQREEFDKYVGELDQVCVGFQNQWHQELITAVFQGIENGDISN